MIFDVLYCHHEQMSQFARIFWGYLDAPEKWTQTWKVRLIQEKNPGEDHCDAQWIPAFAGITGTHD